MLLKDISRRTGMLLGFAVLSLPVLTLASEVQVAGSANGAFDGGTPGCAATLLGLSYSCGVFSAATSGGTAQIAGWNGNFGTFANNQGGEPGGSLGAFSLFLTFTAPLGVTATPAPIYNATVTGTISDAGAAGAVLIAFSDYSRTFTFSNSLSEGAFTLSVKDMTIAAGQSAALVGVITGAYQNQSPIFSAQDVPEPGTALLLGGGLGCLAWRLRRRRSGGAKG